MFLKKTSVDGLIYDLLEYFYIGYKTVCRLFSYLIIFLINFITLYIVTQRFLMKFFFTKNSHDDIM